MLKIWGLTKKTKVKIDNAASSRGQWNL